LQLQLNGNANGFTSKEVLTNLRFAYDSTCINTLVIICIVRDTDDNMGNNVLRRSFGLSLGVSRTFTRGRASPKITLMRDLHGE